MSVKNKARYKFSKYLEVAGLKLTAVREIVLSKALKRHGHFSAEELLRMINKKHNKASRASVYRSIRELLEAGIIRQTAFGEKHKHYEHTYDKKHHHHARCIRCGRIIEFPCFKREKYYEASLRKKGFLIIGHEIHFYGLCNSCKDS